MTLRVGSGVWKFMYRAIVGGVKVERHRRMRFFERRIVGIEGVELLVGSAAD